MGKFWPVLIATLQYTLSIYVFKKPDLSGCGPLVSSLFVLMALCVLLWNLPLYPRRLRRLVFVGDVFAQYLIALFLIEYIMGCFWFPLEAAILVLLPKIATTLEETLLYIDMTCHFPCDMLKLEGTGTFASYFVAFLILLAALHATRVINLQLCSYGIAAFIQDTIRRFKKFWRKYPITRRVLSYQRVRPVSKSNVCADEDYWDPDDDEPYEYIYK